MDYDYRLRKGNSNPLVLWQWCQNLNSEIMIFVLKSVTLSLLDPSMRHLKSVKIHNIWPLLCSLDDCHYTDNFIFIYLFFINLLCCRLDDWGTRVQFPAGARHFSPLHSVQTSSGSHPAIYLMGTKDFFSEKKSRQGVKLTTHLYLGPRLIIHGVVLPFPHMSSYVMLIEVHGQFYFLLVATVDLGTGWAPQWWSDWNKCIVFKGFQVQFICIIKTKKYSFKMTPNHLKMGAEPAPKMWCVSQVVVNV